MAEFINASSRLSLRVQIGTNDEGRPILRSLSLRDVSADAVEIGRASCRERV